MTPEFITFGISHYCEKARWALDWHGIPYREIGWPPGLHVALARRAGARQSHVPILRSAEGLVQGSSQIIDWADAQAPDPGRRLTIDDDPATARAMERRADNGIGIHVRRFMYAQILPTRAELVKPYLLMNTSPGHRLIGNLSWPAVRRLMIKAMGTTPEAVPECRARFEAELAWLDGLLGDGRRFLIGDRLSRVDITVAALLAPAVRPAEAATYCSMQLPAALEGDLDAWTDRPTFRWVRAVYRNFRGGPS